MAADEFIALIAAQKQLIAEWGFDGYLPTLWVVSANAVDVNVLADAPDGDELERIARDWAQQKAQKHDYYLAFKADDSHLKIVARVGAVTSEELVQVDFE
jgi:hypothetical protein